MATITNFQKPVKASISVQRNFFSNSFGGQKSDSSIPGTKSRCWESQAPYSCSSGASSCILYATGVVIVLPSYLHKVGMMSK